MKLLADAPRVSVVIPAYNRACYIGKALDSLLAQTFEDLEIIVVDDASIDDTANRVEAYADSRIRLLSHTENRGLAAARNTGIAEARGEYIAFLDSDDRATPDRLSRQIAFLDAHPDHAGVSCWLRWIDADGRRTSKTKRKADCWRQIAAEMLFRSPIEVSGATTRTVVLREHPHNETLTRAEDYDLWSRIAVAHRLATIPHVLLERRRHNGQMTTDKQADQEIKRCRLKVFADQFDRLGIDYNTTDLENHYLLRRMHKSGVRPGREYLLWAADWLIRLQKANRRARIYPEPEFSGVLALFWAKACWGARWSAGLYAISILTPRELLASMWRGVQAERKTRLRWSR